MQDVLSFCGCQQTQRLTHLACVVWSFARNRSAVEHSLTLRTQLSVHSHHPGAGPLRRKSRARTDRQGQAAAAAGPAVGRGQTLRMPAWPWALALGAAAGGATPTATRYMDMTLYSTPLTTKAHLHFSTGQYCAVLYSSHNNQHASSRSKA